MILVLGRISASSNEEDRKKEEKNSEDVQKFLQTQWLEEDYKISRGAKALLEKNEQVCCDCTDDCFTARCRCRQKTRLGVEDYNKKTLDPAKQITAENVSGYDRQGLLHDYLPSGIYECGKNCKCNARKCTQRVSQKGLTQQVEVRRTVKIDEVDCGMSVYAMSPIPKGSFITRYLGMVSQTAGCLLSL